MICASRHATRVDWESTTPLGSDRMLFSEFRINSASYYSTLRLELVGPRMVRIGCISRVAYR